MTSQGAIAGGLEIGMATPDAANLIEKAFANGSEGIPPPTAHNKPTYAGLPLIDVISIENNGAKYNGSFPTGVDFSNTLLVVAEREGRYVGNLIRSPWGIEGYRVLNGKVRLYELYALPPGAEEFSVEITNKEK